MIEFISAAFSGEVTFRKARPDGAIMHAEMRIGDSMLMVADSTEQFAPTTSSIYLYVADCDAVYQSALRAGGGCGVPRGRLCLLESGMAVSKTNAATSGGLPHTSRMCAPAEEERRWKAFKMP